jgi:hypothetical protein
MLEGVDMWEFQIEKARLNFMLRDAQQRIIRL